MSLVAYCLFKFSLFHVIHMIMQAKKEGKEKRMFMQTHMLILPAEFIIPGRPSPDF